MGLSLIVIQDPQHKDYSKVFIKVLQSSNLISFDVQLNCVIESANELNAILMHLYTQIRQLATESGYDYKLDINILFNKVNYNDYSTIYHATSEQVPSFIPSYNLISLDVKVPDLFPITATNTNSTTADTSETIGNTKIIGTSETLGKFDVVAVGGTFDHIHDGHKILLSLAVFLTRKILIVGITDDELLQNKQFKEYLEPFETRLRIANGFIQKIGTTNQEYDFYRINDVYGPTGYLKNIDCLVLSQESAKGGQMVNKRRQELTLPLLDIFTIDLVGGDNKLSSTDLRRLDMEEHQHPTKKRKVI